MLLCCHQTSKQHGKSDKRDTGMLYSVMSASYEKLDRDKEGAGVPSSHCKASGWHKHHVRRAVPMQIPLSEFDLPAVYSSRCWVTDVRVGVIIVRTSVSYKPSEKAAFFPCYCWHCALKLVLACCVIDTFNR